MDKESIPGVTRTVLSIILRVSSGRSDWTDGEVQANSDRTPKQISNLISYLFEKLFKFIYN